MDLVEQVRAAADRTVAAGTAHLVMTAPSPTGTPAGVAGTVDFSRRRSWARVEMPWVGESGESGAASVEMIIDGADLYLEVLGHPGRFVRTRLDEHHDAMPPGDPGLLLDWLRGCTDARPAEAEAAAEGADSAESDRGLLALDTLLDLDRAAEAAPEASRRAVRLWMDQVAPDGHPRPATVWLDAKGRVHRLTVHDVGGPLDVRLTHHAQPVDIVLPDEGALVDPSDLERLLPDLPDVPEPPAGWDKA